MMQLPPFLKKKNPVLTTAIEKCLHYTTYVGADTQHCINITALSSEQKQYKLYSGHIWDSLACPEKGGVLISVAILYTSTFSALRRCSHFRGILLEGFHCVYL